MQYLLQGTSALFRARILVFVLPVLFTLAALGLAGEAALFAAGAERITAEVVRVYAHPDGTFSPLLRYAAAAGPVEAGLWVSSEAYDFPVGSLHAALVHPADPWTLRLDDWASSWGLPAVIGAMALPLWGAALLVWPHVARRWRRQEPPANLPPG